MSTINWIGLRTGFPAAIQDAEEWDGDSWDIDQVTNPTEPYYNPIYFPKRTTFGDKTLCPVGLTFAQLSKILFRVKKWAIQIELSLWNGEIQYDEWDVAADEVSLFKGLIINGEHGRVGESDLSFGLFSPVIEDIPFNLGVATPWPYANRSQGFNQIWYTIHTYPTGQGKEAGSL